MSQGPFVPIEECAKHFAVSVSTIRSWIRQGFIPKDTYLKVGLTYRFDLSAIIKALSANPDDGLPEVPVEAMVAGAKAIGLSESDATTLTIQTIVGAAQLLDESGKSPTTLRENVTSPNGTTAAALASFGSSDLNSMVATAMKAARDRSQELA